MHFALPQSMPIDLPVTVGPATRMLMRGGFLLVGWALEETTNAAGANLYLRDGERNADAPMRVPIRLAANESRSDSVTGLGIIFERALLVDVVAGSVQGALYVVPTELLRTEGGLVIMGESRPGYLEPLGVEGY